MCNRADKGVRASKEVSTDNTFVGGGIHRPGSVYIFNDALERVKGLPQHLIFDSIEAAAGFPRAPVVQGDPVAARRARKGQPPDLLGWCTAVCIVRA